MNDEIITSYLLGKKAGGGGTPPVYQDKEITITSNGEQTITKDSGYDALNSVALTVNVPQPSGKISITQNGTDIDVSSYATADVNVGGSSTPESPQAVSNDYSSATTDYCTYLNNVVANRTAYTNNSITLYTPDANNKSYLIFYREQFQDYMVVWLPTDKVIKWYSNYLNGVWGYREFKKTSTANTTPISLNNNNNGFYKNEIESIEITDENPARFAKVYTAYGGASSLEDAFAKLQSDQTNYYTSSNSYYGQNLGVDPTTLVYSNCVVFTRDTNGNDVVVDTDTLSHNETIEVIGA